MPNFKAASWTPEKVQTAKQELDNIFKEAVVGTKGRYNPRSVQKIHEARFDIAELIIRIVEETVLLSDPIPFLVDSEEGTVGDRKVFQRINSALRVVNRSPASKPLSQRFTWKEWEIFTSQKEVNVEIPLEKVAVGRVTPSQVAERMATAILRDRIKTVLNAIDTAVDAVADRTGESGYLLRYSGFTQANFDKAVNGMLDEAEAPALFGRHVALAPAIQGFATTATALSDEVRGELTVRGLIGTYRNAAIVTLKDQFAETSADHVIPKDRIYGASGRKGAILETKDIGFLDYVEVDARSATFMAGRRVEYGVTVWDKYRYRVLSA